MSSAPAPKKAKKAKKAKKRADEEEPREPSRVLNIGGLPHGLNPLDPFHDMVTKFDDDIVKMTAPARDLVAPGKLPGKVCNSKIAEIVFRTPEAAQKAHDMIVGRVAAYGSKYDIYLSDPGPATKRFREVLGDEPSKDFAFEVYNGDVCLCPVAQDTCELGPDSPYYVGSWNNARLRECLATMKWASFYLE